MTVKHTTLLTMVFNKSDCTMSAASIVVAVPVPMAMPRSACRNGTRCGD